MTENRIKYEKAVEQGKQARRSGKKRGANPYHGYTEHVRMQHQAWEEGWTAQDMELRRAA